MASREREVKVTVLGEDRGGKKVLADLGDQADHADSKMGKLTNGIGNFGKAAAIGFGGAIVGGVAFLKGAAEAAEESRKVMAQSEAVIKSTGGAANITADQMGDLASKLSMLTGIDDELIQSNENLLATFTNVKNEVGEGNDIFSQANKTILDMSVALGQDGKASAIQLGKALNDPIKGVTALQKVGVTFTAQQKEQIKAMVEAGDTLGAQKVILAELNKEFGGSAEAAASPMAKLKVAFGNLQEQVGGLLLPVLGKAASALSGLLNGVTPGIEKFFGLVQNAFKGGQADTNFLDHLVGGIRAFIGAFQNASDGITSSGFAGRMEAIAITVRRVVDTVREHWPEVQKIVTEVLTAITTVVMGAVDIIMAVWNNFGSQLTNVIGIAWEFVRNLIENALNVIQGLVKIITGIIHGDWSQVWEGIKQVFGAVWDQILNILSTALGLLKEALLIVGEILVSIFSSAWEGAKNAVAAGVAAVIDYHLAMPGRILRALGDIGRLLYNAGRSIITGLWDGMKDAAVGMLNWVGGLAGKISRLKGPLDYDRRLLTPAGEAIMRGLMDGLRNEESRLVAQLSHITGLVSNGLSQAEDGSVVPSSFYGPAPGGGNADRRSDSWYARQDAATRAQYTPSPGGGWVPVPAGTQPLVVQVVLDGRVLAESVVSRIPQLKRRDAGVLG